MFRGFLSLSTGALVLLCVSGTPGRLHAQPIRSVFRPGLALSPVSRFSPGFDRRFFDPRFGTFNRGFVPRVFDPRLGRFVPAVDPRFFNPFFGGFRPGLDRRFFDPRFGGF